MTIEALTEIDQLELLLESSVVEGYRFVTRLMDDYRSGANRFAERGELLLVARADDATVLQRFPSSSHGLAGGRVSDSLEIRCSFLLAPLAMFVGRDSTNMGNAVGVCGLNAAARAGVGRVRRFYVLPAMRSRGIGAALLEQIVSAARLHFTRLELHTDSPRAAAFYVAHGFRSVQRQDATHELELNPC